jgi:sugar phosphate permease
MSAAARSDAVTIRLMKNSATGAVKPAPVSRQADGTFVALAIADKPKLFALVALVFSQTVLLAMVSGPIVAYLVKLFPAKIRCVSLSLLYQLGNSLFGGALPLISFALIPSTHSIYGGLFYPGAVLLLTFIVGSFVAKEADRTVVQ